jgi:hypothetical protein
MSGVLLTRISELLGHKDEKTTRLYIEIDIDLKNDAMTQVAQWRLQQRSQMGLPQNRAFSSEASKLSGKSGILIRQTDWLTPHLYQERYKPIVRGYSR